MGAKAKGEVNEVERMVVTLKPCDEPVSLLPNIALACCHRGEFSRLTGPNVFAGMLVAAGLVARHRCTCEWCELGRRASGIRGLSSEENHPPEDDMRLCLMALRDSIADTLDGRRLARPLSRAMDDIDRLLTRWQPADPTTCAALDDAQALQQDACKIAKKKTAAKKRTE